MKGKPYKFIEVPAIPLTLEDGVVYVDREIDKAFFLCPCGCREVIELHLNETIDRTIPIEKRGPSWSIKGNDIYPSINRLVGCMSHFEIKNGAVK